MMTRILGLGDNTVDIYVDQGVQFPGGNALNVAVLSKRLGIEASYLGYVGSGVLGELVHQALKAEDVDISRLQHVAETNPWARIRHIGADRSFDGDHPTQRGALKLGRDDFDFIASHTITHSSIYSELEDALPSIADAAQTLSFDFSDSFDEDYLERNARFIDIAFLSGADASDEACIGLCNRVFGYGADLVVITRGAEGSMAFDGYKFYRQSILQGEIVDTLGAGDGFVSGFLVARLRGENLPKALELGAVNATKVCGYKGGFGHGIAIQAEQAGLKPTAP